MVRSGGFGQVVEVRDKRNGNNYALKKCLLDIPGLTDKHKQNLMRETQNMIKLRSKYIIQYHYSWIQYNSLYILMDRLDGSLKELLIIKRQYIKLCDFGLSKEVHVLSDRYKQSNVKHTENVVHYMAPEGQTTEYNHLIDVYSLALIGAKIFGFDSNDIRDGVYVML
ncbi:unnamed protein product [Medioppia subpectinata]|uniref:Protein kinase domain-containing protein n=1 Tax=Medioppia subpectinata TaxID=1979941 RepID=A0A7R9L6R2_9ACAR|nr:unnamed protein product [Medioppia subpectinata]CAG2115460.1 unnamed protein product [Medioppia subpectinata]